MLLKQVGNLGRGASYQLFPLQQRLKRGARHDRSRAVASGRRRQTASGHATRHQGRDPRLAPGTSSCITHAPMDLINSLQLTSHARSRINS